MKLRSAIRIAALSTLAVSSPSFAALESTATAMSAPSESKANIQSGNWNVGGYVDSMKYAGARNDEVSLSSSVALKYFLIDRLALGWAVHVDASSEEDSFASTGPIASYFFWNDGKLASYVGAGFRAGLTEATVDTAFQGFLGAEYFVVPSVAVGPSLFLTHYLRDNGTHFQRFGMTFGLSVFL
jgi:hypothetical protein